MFTTAETARYTSGVTEFPRDFRYAAKKLYTNLAMIGAIHSVEFEIVSYITERTGNKQIAKFIGKIFAQYD